MSSARSDDAGSGVWRRIQGIEPGKLPQGLESYMHDLSNLAALATLSLKSDCSGPGRKEPSSGGHDAQPLCESAMLEAVSSTAPRASCSWWRRNVWPSREICRPPAAPQLRRQPRQVERYWLCDRCAEVWTLVHELRRGVVLMPLLRPAGAVRVTMAKEYRESA